MTDYSRMERHLRYRKVAFGVVLFCLVSTLPEGMAAIRYHFPIWDDICIFATFLLFYAARVVIKRTEMYVVPR